MTDDLRGPVNVVTPRGKPGPMYILQREQWIPRSIEATFAFFADAGNLEAITPDWLRFQILTPGPISMRAGTQIAFRLRWRWFPVRWLTGIHTWNPPVRFVDVQLQGPYRLWKHEHTFATCKGGTLMRDIVHYALPCGPLGQLAHRWFVKSDLDQIFHYRTLRIASLLGF